MDWFKKRHREFVDFYIESSIIFDLLLGFGIVISLSFFNEEYICFGNEKINSILDRINNHSMTLTGFILACLTIIISIKASVKRGKVTDNSSNIEILFNSKHYKVIVSVFYKAMFMYGVIHILSHMMILYNQVIAFDFLTNYVITLSIISYSILLRCFFVLWLVIKHEIEK